MQKNGRLCDFRLFQVFLRSVEHDIRKPESQNFIGCFKEPSGKGIAIIMILTHTWKLGTLTWKNIRLYHIAT